MKWLWSFLRNLPFLAWVYLRRHTPPQSMPRLPDASAAAPELAARIKEELRRDMANRPMIHEAQREAGRRFNVYLCDRCPRYLVTEDIDQGVTPFIVPCQCKGAMMSRMYCPPTLWPPHVMRTVTHEWWKEPVTRSMRRHRPLLANHLDAGGLSLRELRTPRVMT